MQTSYIADPLIIVLMFLLVHFFVGAALLTRRAQKPFFRQFIESAGHEIDRRLNRPGRTQSDLVARGCVASLIVGGSAFVVGLAVQRIAMYEYGWIATFIFLAVNISVMGPLGMMRQASKFPMAVQPFTQVNLEKADEHTVARRALEASAASLNDFLVGPIFWFLALQAPGLAVYVALMALADAFGHEDAKHLSFGAFVRTIEKIMNYVPARLTAMFIVLAAVFVSKSNPLRAFATALTQGRGFHPVNRGLLIAAAAGGLGVTLGGPIKHNEKHTAAHAWVGPKGSSAKLTHEDLKRGAMLHFITFLCIFCALAMLVAAQSKLS